MVSDFDCNVVGKGKKTRLEELKEGSDRSVGPANRVGVVDGHVQMHLHLPAYDGALGSGLTGMGLSDWWVW